MIDFTPFLRLYAAQRLRKLEAQHPAETQRNQLLRLVRRARDTVFGRAHNFASITSIEDFQQRIKLRRYEDFWEEYWKPAFPILENLTWPGKIPYFPVTSGTTSGTTKYIPCSAEMWASNRKAGLDILVHHIANRPASRVFGGKSFVLGGSTELVQEAPGIFSGDLSGIVAKLTPWWARPFYFPPPDLALLKDWEQKMERLSRASLQQDIRMISGVPSWLLILARKLFELRPEAEGRLSAIYPNLELLVHGGVNFGPYLKQFQDLLAGSRAELREVYPASEGFIAIADRGSNEGLRLNLDHGIFYEFVPLEELASDSPTRHWVGNIETGVNYAIVLTTCAGLWSYVIGDTVKFIESSPPRLLVTGRTSYMLSAFGEHLIGEEIEDGVTSAAAGIARSMVDYSVGAVFPKDSSELGRHRYVLEFSGGIPDAGELAQFTAALDKRLQVRNEDYAAHRAEGFGLNPPELIPVPPGTFAAWMKARGKLGGQHKVPRIITDRTLFDDLSAFAERSRR